MHAMQRTCPVSSSTLRPGTIVTHVLLAATLLAATSTTQTARSADWPMHRHDARRSAVSPDALPETLHPQWVRTLPRLKPAWSDQQKLDFDTAYAPIVAGHTLFVGSSHDNSLTAFDTRDGQRRWVYYTDGPVRLAPAYADGRVYVASDDGYLYCLDAEHGALVWKFRGGPSDRKLLGNERMISVWPMRGAPVVVDGTVYVAASIWPFMGTFMHALDADTGKVIWTNDGDGSMFMLQPHNSYSFAGVAPQGPLVVAGNRLFYPGGRSIPACYDRHTGKLEFYELAENSKDGGGWEVFVAADTFINGGNAFELSTSHHLGEVGTALVADDAQLCAYSTKANAYLGGPIGDSLIENYESTSRSGRQETRKRLGFQPTWQVAAPGGLCLIQAGDRYYGASIDGDVVAIERPAIDPPADETPMDEPSADAVAEGEGETASAQLAEGQIAWSQKVDGTIARLIAADDRLFVVTEEGRIYCFGADEGTTDKAVKQLADAPVPLQASAAARQRAATILAAADDKKVDGGYALVWGAGSGDLVAALLTDTEMRLVIVEPSPHTANRLREQIAAAGISAERATVLIADPNRVELPPYFASLIICEDPAAVGLDMSAESVKRNFASLHPFGGTAVFALTPNGHDQAVGLLKSVGQAIDNHTDDGQPINAYCVGMADVVATRHDTLSAFQRKGPLPGTANWTHEHANASNTRASDDDLVRAPLGMLWFGGLSHEDVLPRHGHGPQPQVVEGRAIVEGMDMIRAVDIYTGRLLWQTPLPGVGDFYNYLGHQPGANATGTNFISTPDGIYVAWGDKCVRLDPDSGETVATFTIPPAADGGPSPLWGYINVIDDYLIAGTDPLVVEVDQLTERPKPGKNENLSSSTQLVVMDRHSGKVAWRADAVNGFRHNAICAGGNRLYAVDLLSQGLKARLRRRGEEPSSQSTLTAFNIATGDVLWSTDQDVFGTWLSYSGEHDVLIEAGRPNRDVLPDEARGMRAYDAESGNVLWYEAEYAGPAMISGETIHKPFSACELLTGKPLTKPDPVTGQDVEWTWKRNYGCNTPLASRHLLTFRSGAAGYYDLAGDGGTGNFGGFRSGCSNNLIPAGGVLTVPDYTRTCVCGYQNQTSLALVHTPSVEMWTEMNLDTDGAIERVGLNLGAPGLRRDANGMIWINEADFAEVNYDAAITGLGPYSRHSSHTSGDSPAWVSASGCRGVEKIVIDPRLAENDAPAKYRVRLHFADPDNDTAGSRVFAVRLQGNNALEGFDVVAESGGRDRSIVKQFDGVEVADKLVIEFTAESGSSAKTAPLVCGIEIEREN
ncbi:MAG: PQQ-binding-like beta-propeller repeat protein [Pirellulales bacterium]